MKRGLFMALMVAAVAMQLTGCCGPSIGSDGKVTGGGDTKVPPNTALADALNGKWMGGRAQTLEWKLTGGKGTVTYTEDTAGHIEGAAEVDVVANGPDFDCVVDAGTVIPMRVRYVSADVLIVRLVRTKPEGVQVMRSDPYARTSEAAQALMTSMADATPGYHWDVVTRPGEQTYYERLVSQGLLKKSDNLVGQAE